MDTPMYNHLPPNRRPTHPRLGLESRPAFGMCRWTVAAPTAGGAHRWRSRWSVLHWLRRRRRSRLREEAVDPRGQDAGDAGDLIIKGR